MLDILLQVDSIETKHSEKLACDYKVIKFVEVKFRGNREVLSNVEATRTLWPTHEVTLKDGSKTTIKGDSMYHRINQGDLVDGSVARFDTTPYQIAGSNRKAESWSGVIFSGENPLSVCARNLRQYNASPIDKETGEIFKVQSAGTTAANPKVVAPEVAAVTEP